MAVSLLLFLGVVVHRTTAFSSNIHERMTSSEIFETFGTSDSLIPDYQVFSVALPESRRRRETNDDIEMQIELESKNLALKLQPTEGFLASKYTPVWKVSTNEEAYKQLRYDPQENAMAEVGEFKMYQDAKNEAAIVVYQDAKEGSVIEGIVTNDYAIKSLPKRLMAEKLKLGDHLVKSFLPHKRSINDIGDDEMHYFVVYPISSPLGITKRSPRRHSSQNKYVVARKPPDVVYPEFLLILDHNAVRNHTITQALRFMLAFWNGVDMVYSVLDEPKVRLNIAGIIVSMDDKATPYFSNDSSTVAVTDVYMALRRMGRHFFLESDRFPLSHYDSIIIMTTMHMCNEPIDPCFGIMGVAATGMACTTDEDRQLHGIVGSTSVIHYEWNYFGVGVAAHEAGHLFGVLHDSAETGKNECYTNEGYAMAKYVWSNENSLKWSKCSLDYFHKYFWSNVSSCLDNPPKWIKPVDEVLGGRWLTLDGQCKNEGFIKGCKVPKIPICLAKGCKGNDSDECTISQWSTLSGTRCGKNKFCNSKSACVLE